MKMSILALIILSFQGAFATEGGSVTISPKPTYKTRSGLSLDNREGKNFQLTAQPLGVNPTGTIGSGLNLGYYIDSNSLIVAEATVTNTSSDFWWTSEKMKGHTFGVHYKRFVGNSFYFKVGVDQRRLKYTHTYDGWLWYDNGDTVTEFTVDSTAAALVIGNQWQWNSFTMGCDWIGVSAPLNQKYSGEYISSNATSYDYNRHERDKKRYGKEAIAQGVRLYLGASF